MQFVCFLSVDYCEQPPNKVIKYAKLLEQKKSMMTQDLPINSNAFKKAYMGQNFE